jgi:hypothetical protein
VQVLIAAKATPAKATRSTPPTTAKSAALLICPLLYLFSFSTPPYYQQAMNPQ